MSKSDGTTPGTTDYDGLDEQDEKQQLVSTPADQQDKRKVPQSKRDRLQRNPSLEKVDEDLEFPASEAHKKKACPDYFGVRSYLHNFYEYHGKKDPIVYEEDDWEYLLRAGGRNPRCRSIWWKVFVWIGANFLFFGIIGVLVGYLVPKRSVIMGTIADNIEIIDRQAIAFNFNLDVCKLVGLVLFCVGGLTLTVALLFPSFLYNYCDEERRHHGDGLLHVHNQETASLISPLEMTVPATSHITEVQPERKIDLDHRLITE